MNKNFYSAFIVLCLLLAVSTAGSKISVNAATTVIHVPVDYPTIQLAINNANPGDIVAVDNGTYYENLVLNKSRVRLLGEVNFPNETILDGSMNGYAIEVRGQVTGVEIGYFTIRNATTGIYMSALDSAITSNIIENVTSGITFEHSTGNRVYNNNITSSFTGIWLGLSCSNNSIFRNGISSPVQGIYVSLGTNNILSENRITASEYNRMAGGAYAGGINLFSSTYNIISGNDVTNCVKGIVLEGSSNNNKVSGNNVVAILSPFGSQAYTYYSLCCIQISNSTGNILSRNNVEGARVMYGLDLDEGASNNSIFENTIAGNAIGIFCDANYNRLHHNVFEDNIYNAFAFGSSVNIWDDGYPNGGNFWSDYNGTDQYYGPYQNLTGSDYIGDIAYVINENNTDAYPLTSVASQDAMVGYRNILLKYDKLTSDLEASLNSTRSDLQQQITSLNKTLVDMSQSVTNLQGQLNSQNSSLHTSIDNLQAQLGQLNSTLQTSMSSLNEQYTSLGSQVNTITNVMYLLVAIVVILTATTAYFATRKTKMQTDPK